MRPALLCLLVALAGCIITGYYASSTAGPTGWYDVLFLASSGAFLISVVLVVSRIASASMFHDWSWLDAKARRRPGSRGDDAKGPRSPR
jgi:hypothetical protein